MSLAAVNAVLAHSQAEQSTRLVAVVLAHHENKQGVSFPAQSTIAKEAGVNVRTVQRALKWLVENGEFLVEPRPGHRSYHQYHCLLTGSNVVSETRKTGSDVVSQTWKPDQMSPQDVRDVASETYEMSSAIGTTKELSIELKGKASPDSKARSKAVVSEELSEAVENIWALTAKPSSRFPNNPRSTSIPGDPVEQKSNAKMFLLQLWPPVGEYDAPVHVQTWCDRIPPHRLAAAARELECGEYPGPAGATTVGWSELQEPDKKRIVTNVFNEMLGQHSAQGERRSTTRRV